MLSVAQTMLEERYGEDAVWEWLNPPTEAEKRAAHLEQLRALGIPVQAA